MKYSGKDLYDIWRRKLSELGCEADEWEDLDETDRKAWCLLAIELRGDE